VLHSRPFREHHHILELLTPDQGRVSVVGSDPRPELFRRLRVRLTGQGELQQLRDWTYVEPARLHSGQALLCAFYVNEVCMRLLPRSQSDSGFFGAYASTLVQLPLGSERTEAALRFFERRLLETLGYAIDYRRAMDSGQWIRADLWYRFDPALGFCEWGEHRSIPGQAIIAMSRNDWQSCGAHDWGARIHAERMTHLLEGRPCYTRQWLAQLNARQPRN
jgi:DNA repair protein RecO (recombination protein O)